MPNKIIAAIISITILETAAIIKGVDGALFGLAITAIAGLGGFTLARLTKPKQ